MNPEKLKQWLKHVCIWNQICGFLPYVKLKFKKKFDKENEVLILKKSHFTSI